MLQLHAERIMSVLESDSGRFSFVDAINSSGFRFLILFCELVLRRLSEWVFRISNHACAQRAFEGRIPTSQNLDAYSPGSKSLM